jgi:hypothetical protein
MPDTRRIPRRPGVRAASCWRASPPAKARGLPRFLAPHSPRVRAASGGPARAPLLKRRGGLLPPQAGLPGHIRRVGGRRPRLQPLPGIYPLRAAPSWDLASPAHPAPSPCSPSAAPRPPGAPPVRPTTGPSPFSGQAAALRPAAGRALSRPRSAERSEGSLDRRSPPGRYTLVPPGRAGVLAPGRPLGGSGNAGTARSERKPRGVGGWSARTGTAPGGRGAELGNGRPPQPSGSRPC